MVIAAITSCTNTSNPRCMIGAGLLARNAVARGLKAQPWVKTSLSPGSRVVAVPEERPADALERSASARRLRLHDLHGQLRRAADAESREAIETRPDRGAVLSGNRNFDGRIHPAVRANFLASPPLVVAYALAGTVLFNLDQRAARLAPTASRSTCATSGPTAGDPPHHRAALTPALFASATPPSSRAARMAGLTRAGATVRVEAGQHFHPAAALLRGHAASRRRPRISAARGCWACSATC